MTNDGFNWEKKQICNIDVKNQWAKMVDIASFRVGLTVIDALTTIDALTMYRKKMRNVENFASSFAQVEGQ